MMSKIQIVTDDQASPPSTPEPMVIGAIGDGHWRPLSSISNNHALTPDISEIENQDDECKPELSSDTKSSVSVSLDAVGSTPKEPLRVQGLASFLIPRDAQSSRATTTASNKTNNLRRRPRLRTAPGKIQHTAELDKAFATMDDRSRVTFDGIGGNTRTSLNEFGDRICRPYSVYTVTKQCERLAISPFGGPLMDSASGRYRERYLNKYRPDVIQNVSRESVKIKFQRFYENVDLLEIKVKRIPFGTLRKPPPKQVRKTDYQIKSLPTQLHRYTNERVANLHESIKRQEAPSTNSEGKRLGVMSVEYKVAMEVSSNLEKHRRGRISTLPGRTNLPGRMNVLRLQSQAQSRLTPGEVSLREGISTNLYDPERSKRGPIRAIKTPPRRVKSPPLSKLSKETFLPEATRQGNQVRWADLRIGKPAATAVTATIIGVENSHKTKVSSRDQLDGPSSQGNETLQKDNAPVVLKEESKSGIVVSDKSNDPHLSDYRSENDESNKSEKTCENSECTTRTVSENNSDLKKNRPDEDIQNTNNPPPVRTLVLAIPDTEGASETIAVTDEGAVDLISENH